MIPFELKNAGATYQRAMNTIFHEHIRKTVKYYVDDIAVKSRAKGITLLIWKEHSTSCRRINWRWTQPSPSWVLEFIVTSKGIHLDPEKVRAIQEMQPPINLRVLRGLQERLAYIRRFISNLSRQCQPFTKLIKKGVSFIWDNACQEAFGKIKQYLTHPPVFAAPVSGKSFLIYVRVMDHSLWALLTQNND